MDQGSNRLHWPRQLCSEVCTTIAERFLDFGGNQLGRLHIDWAISTDKSTASEYGFSTSIQMQTHARMLSSMSWQAIISRTNFAVARASWLTLRSHIEQFTVNPVSAKPVPPSRAISPHVHGTDKVLLQAGHVMKTVFPITDASKGSPVMFSICATEGWYIDDIPQLLGPISAPTLTEKRRGTNMSSLKQTTR